MLRPGSAALPRPWPAASPTSAPPGIIAGRLAPMPSAGDDGSEDGDGVEAEVVRAGQNVGAGAWIAGRAPAGPVLRGYEVADAIAPVPVEDGLLDVGVVGRAQG